MCVRPVNIYNQSRHITRGMPFQMSVSCGKCYQCQRQKSLVYHLRSFYEAQDCFNKNGFVYSVTLTYDDVNLPHISDFAENELLKHCDAVCFAYPHFRLFMVRLRQLLHVLGFHVANNLRYFVASEFGKKNTFRPHYHLLLFCTIPDMTNEILSSAVSVSWTYGLTDGLSPQRLKSFCPQMYDVDLRAYDRYYKDLVYINEHTYYSTASTASVNICIEYVTKYIEKQQYFSKYVNDNFDVLCHRFCIGSDTRQYKDIKKEYYKYCNQFHRQSQGYGLSALNDPRNSLENIMRTGCIVFFTAKGCAQSVQLPQYYARKLFYDLIKDQHGKLHWQLNDNGVSFRLDRIDSAISSHVLDTSDLINNYASEKEKQYIIDLLDGRSLDSYCRYVVCYKGRVCDPEQIHLDDYTELYHLGLRPQFDDVYYNYQTSVDRAKYGSSLVSCVDLHKTKCSFKNRKGSYHWQLMTHYLNFHYDFVRADVKEVISKLPFCMTNEEFKKHIVTQDSHPAFRHYDTLFIFLASMKYRYSESMASAAELVSKLKFNQN